MGGGGGRGVHGNPHPEFEIVEPRGKKKGGGALCFIPFINGDFQKKKREGNGFCRDLSTNCSAKGKGNIMRTSMPSFTPMEKKKKRRRAP